MEKIIDPISLELIKAELTSDKKLIDTNKGGNEIYVVTWQDSPNVVKEIGRLREIAYREAGASSGKSMDLDEFDTMANPYRQLIVWDPEAQAIVGGYRYILGPDVSIKSDGQPNLTSSHLYHFSDEFITHYLPHTMELGRSFVTPEYQSSKAGAKAIFAMDNLWDGIASVILSHPNIIYFFGKMTIYPSYDQTARDLIMHFLWKHFNDKDNLVRPYHPVMPESNPHLMDLILAKEEVKQDYRCLKDAVHRLGTHIPPLVNSYINTSSTMKMCGTSINDELAGAIETAIMICFDEIYEDKKARHIESFENSYYARLRARFPRIAPGFEERMRHNREMRRKKLFMAFLRKKVRTGSPDIEFL